MLDKLEKVAKIISLLAIPFLLWWLGTTFQTADTKAKTAVEYVKLSISIIENQNEVDPALLEWATKTLNEYSKVKLGKPLATAIATGQVNVAPAPSESGWFAVVGSPHSQSDALELVESIKGRLPSDLDAQQLQIYKTDISDIYAVTIGGETSRSEAVSRARSIREAGLISDAYAQRDRGWTRVESSK
jgi:hypothetical protein